MSAQAIRLSVIGAVIIGVVGFKMIAGNSVEKKLDQMVEKSHGSWSYEDASVDIFGGDIHVDGIKIKNGNKDIVVNEVIIHSYDKDNEVPQYMNFEVDGIQIGKDVLATSPQLAKMAQDLGYEELEANLAMNYNVDKEKKVLELKELSFSVNDAGELDLKADIHGITDVRQLVILAMRPSAVKLGNASLTYEDDSLVNRMIKADAKKSGITAAEAKQKILADLQKDIQNYTAKKDTEKVKILKEIYTFIEDPESLEISLKPTKPVSIGAFKYLSNQELKDRLNVEISAD